MRRCDSCKHYTEGVTDQQRKDWSWSNWGQYADGVCHLYFPRGYIGRKPPHPARAAGSCFQWEAKEEYEQIGFELDSTIGEKDERPVQQAGAAHTDVSGRVQGRKKVGAEGEEDE